MVLVAARVWDCDAEKADLPSCDVLEHDRSHIMVADILNRNYLILLCEVEVLDTRVIQLDLIDLVTLLNILNIVGMQVQSYNFVSIGQHYIILEVVNHFVWWALNQCIFKDLSDTLIHLGVGDFIVFICLTVLSIVDLSHHQHTL